MVLLKSKNDCKCPVSNVEWSLSIEIVNQRVVLLDFNRLSNYLLLLVILYLKSRPNREFNMLSNYLLLLVMAMSFAQVDLCCPRNNRVSRNNNDNNRVSRNNNDNNRMSQNNNNRLFCRPRPPSQSRCC